jgi:endoglucanase
MRLRTLKVAIVALGLCAAGLGAAPTTDQASAATPACQVTYSVVNSWNVGFQASITITNNAAAMSGWTLAWTFPNTQQISQLWGGVPTQTGQQVSVQNASYDGSLATGGAVTIGFVGTWAGTNAVPDYFTLNGIACNGAAQRPVVTLTSPAANAVYTAGTAIPLSATAASTSGGTVSSVGFYDGSTLVATSTSTSSPYSASWTTATPGVHHLTARATDSGGGVGISGSAGILVRPAGSTGASQLKVSGNKLVDASGATVTLHGVNRSGAEFACVHGDGIFDGPVDATSVLAMASWKTNVVRVPLNEDCWLGSSNVLPQYAGATYQTAVKNYVALLHQYGLDVILDLHWSDGVYTGLSTGCASATATCQKPMPDAAGGVPFWSSVAAAFKGDNATVFDLFNEPYPERAANYDETLGWTCWRDGGTCTGISYPVAGMQSMVNAIRAAGATNVIMLGGLAYSNDLTQWLTYKPTDSANNLVASWHSYNFNTCSTVACFDSQVAPVAAQVPVVAGEIGENDCGHGYIDTLTSWLDSHSLGYLAWTWNTWDCANGPSLISAYDGTPTPYGAGYQAHLATLG